MFRAVILNKEIPYKSELHSVLLRAIVSRKKAAQDKNNTARFDEADKLFRVYVPPTEDVLDARRRNANGDRDYEEIIVPYATAVLLTAHTYWSSVFLSRDPIFQFAGLNGEGENNILALESLVNYQINIGGAIPKLFSWLMDVGKYGRGIVSIHWEEEKFQVAHYQNVPRMFAGEAIPDEFDKELVRVPMEGFIGNRISNVRPHNFIYDTRVSFADLQKGEFAGELTRVSSAFLQRKKALKEWFNVEEALDSHEKSPDWDYATSGVPGVEFPDDQTFLHSEENKKKGFYSLTHFIWDLSPSEWKLDDGTSIPEKWIFSVINDAVIVQARPLGCYHNKFPYAVLELECDPYSVGNRGLLEILEPLNKVLTWLVNSHMYSVRSAQNGSIVFDPSRIREGDLRARTKGGQRLIRATANAWGQDVRVAYAQLETRDVTQQHFKDIATIMDLMQRLSGVNENFMGIQDPGGRKTATEIRTSSSMGADRLKTNTNYFSATGWLPLGRMLSANSQQYYTGDRKFLIAGERGQVDPYLQVTPELISGEYMYLPVDGTLPADRYAQIALWKELLATAAADPRIMQTMDTGSIFEYVAQLAGIKNISRFKLKVQEPGVMPPGDMVGLPVGGNQREVPAGTMPLTGPAA